MTLSEKLKTAREQAGLSPTEASELTGINYKTLNNYEHGVSKPDVGKLAVICSAYKVSADYFIRSDYDEMKNSPAPAKAETGELSQDDLELLADYHKLNECGREAARSSVRGLTNAPKFQELKEKHSVEMADIGDDAIRTIDKLAEMTRKSQNNLPLKK